MSKNRPPVHKVARRREVLIMNKVNLSELARKCWFEYRQTKLSNNSASWHLLEDYPIDPPFWFLKYELGWSKRKIQNYQSILNPDTSQSENNEDYEVGIYDWNDILESWEVLKK